jgi:L-fuconolactonase
MTLATSYEAWLELVREALAGYPASAAEAVMSANAQRVYRPRVASPV